jgi:hypothetical protein
MNMVINLTHFGSNFLDSCDDKSTTITSYNNRKSRFDRVGSESNRSHQFYKELNKKLNKRDKKFVDTRKKQRPETESDNNEEYMDTVESKRRNESSTELREMPTTSKLNVFCFNVEANSRIYLQ